MKTGNELIAEFMGYERSKSVWDNDEHAYTMKLPDVFNKWVIPSQMKYETSWDWLMPVVEKLEQVGHRTAITYTQTGGHWCQVSERDHTMLAQQDGETKIQAVYKSVVTFIKWYNSQGK